MNSQFKLRVLSLALLSAMASQVAWAQGLSRDSGFYTGLGLGLTRAKIDEERITAGLLANGATSVAMEVDESSVGGKLFGGYQINRTWAVEAGYFNLGEFGYKANTNTLGIARPPLPVPNFPGSLEGRIKLQGLNLDLVGTMPLAQRWSLLGRVGAQYARAQDTFSTTGTVAAVANANPSKSELNYKLGVGVQYEWSPSVLVRAEAERFRINDAVGNRGDINKFSLSLVFPFGAAPKLAAAAAPEPRAVVVPAPVPAPPPVVVAQAAPPAPVPPPVAAPVVTVQRISLSADSLFNFNKSNFRPDAKESMTKLLDQLKGLQIDSVTVDGHTDRLGSEGYNQQLSEQRAATVKRYLVTFGAIDPDKISSSGKGESSPLTQPAQCKGNKATAKLVACLQKDRRVDVQVTGRR
jgi:OmpA-OmpF porin, OOP family